MIKLVVIISIILISRAASSMENHEEAYPWISIELDGAYELSKNPTEIQLTSWDSKNQTLNKYHINKLYQITYDGQFVDEDQKHIDTLNFSEEQSIRSKLIEKYNLTKLENLVSNIFELTNNYCFFSVDGGISYIANSAGTVSIPMPLVGAGAEHLRLNNEQTVIHAKQTPFSSVLYIISPEKLVGHEKILAIKNKSRRRCLIQ